MTENDKIDMIELQMQRNELLEACHAVHKLLENGTLVRDTSKDHERDWAIKQLPLARVLCQLRRAIENAENPL